MFTKGQPVTYIHQWDSRGTVRVVELTVHSCGKKQMILVDAAGVKFQGHFFRPDGFGGNYGRVLPRLDRAQAEAQALELAVAYQAERRATLETRLQSIAYHHPAVREEIAALHEPRVLFQEEPTA